MENNRPLKRAALIGMGVVGALIVLDGITMPLRSNEMTTIPVHHLLHAGMTVGAGLLAMALAAKLSPPGKERAWWAVPAVLAPAVNLFLMWPTEYAYLMGHPWLHLLDHLGIALCCALTVFAAQAYTRGLGWPTLVLLVAMNAGAAGGFGVTRVPQAAAQCTPATGAPAAAPAVVSELAPITLHALGEKLYQSLGCFSCHHVDGSAAIGPSWKNLAGYPQKLSDGTTVIADYQYLRNAILHPDHLQLQGFPHGVMPTVYGDMLAGPQHPDEKNLNTLIWYINTLSDRSSPATRPPVPDRVGK